MNQDWTLIIYNLFQIIVTLAMSNCLVRHDAIKDWQKLCWLTLSLIKMFDNYIEMKMSDVCWNQFRLTDVDFSTSATRFGLCPTPGEMCRLSVVSTSTWRFWRQEPTRREIVWSAVSTQWINFTVQWSSRFLMERRTYELVKQTNLLIVRLGLYQWKR